MAKNTDFNRNRAMGKFGSDGAQFAVNGGVYSVTLPTSEFKELLRFIIHELYNRSGNDNRDNRANPELSTK